MLLWMSIYPFGKVDLNLGFTYQTRDRYGVKIYMICESTSAYLYSFIIYAGSETKYVDPGVPFPKPFEEYPIYSQVVLSLMEGLFNQGYCVTLDNLYTEPYTDGPF